MIVRTRPEWNRVVEKLKQSRDPDDGLPVISYDTETLDRGYPDVKIVGFSVAWYEPDGTIDGAYVPVGHSTGELQLSPQDVQNDLAVLLEDPEVEVAMQNAKYDIMVSTLFPRPIHISENIFDTMVASWLLNTNGVGSPAAVLAGHGSHGLKDLSKYILKYEMRELTEFAPKEKYTKNNVTFDVLRVDLVSIDDLGGYAWDDAVQTLKLRKHFISALQEDPKVWKIFHKLERSFCFCLGEMEMAGVELDVALLDAMRQSVEQVMEETQKRMFELREGQDFHRIRDAQLVKKLADGYEELEHLFSLPQSDPRYPKNPKTGKPAGKGSVRKQLIAASGLEGHEVVEKIRDDALRPFIRKYPELAHKIFNVNSTQVLNKVLFDECGLEPIGEVGANGMFSTSADNVEAWANQGSELAQALLRYREVAKLHGTYLIGMVARVGADRRIRTRQNRTGTRTGRLSTSDPNLQNIPTSKEFPIRRAFVSTGVTKSKVDILEWHLDKKGNPERPKELRVENAGGGWHVKDGRVVEWWGDDPPWVLMVGDYSQLEICLLAHCSNDPVLVPAVIAGEDVHALTAQGVFDEVPNHISLAEVKEFYAEYRKKAKPINFGVIYGMGPQKLAATLGITVDEADEIINVRYMRKYPGVAAWIQRQHAIARKHGYVMTAIGRKRHLPAATLDPNERRNRALIKQAERQAQNAPIQGFAADVMELSMLRIREYMQNTMLDVANPVMVMPGRNGELPVPGPAFFAGPGHWFNTQDGALWGNHVRMLLQVHDEIVQEFHPSVANYAMDESVRIMENIVQLRVPLRVSAALGANWYDTKE